jgi:hypothetical protein
MKWVHLGLIQGLLFVAIGIYLDKDRWPPLMGGGIAAVILYAQYQHALTSGLEHPGETTEAVH